LEFLNSPKYFEYGDILFAITGESIEEIAKCTAYVGNEKCLAGGDIVVMKHNQNPKYIAYALSTTEAQRQKSKGKVKSKVVHSSVPALKEISIPLPPLEIQSEIVKILDNFAELTAELTAELEKRKKQFEHYRDMLLNFTGGGRYDNISQNEPCPSIEWKRLGDVIMSLKTGLNPRQNFKLNTMKSTCPYITGKDVFNNTINVSERTDLIEPSVVALINKRACIENGDVLFASTGTGTVGRMALVNNYNNDWAVSETMYCLKPKKDKVLSKYLMFVLTSSKAVGQYEPKISKGSVPHLKVADLMNIEIPLPPLAEQERIVAILDRFDSLCNSLTEGLPAEIALRKKQYEYYRDRLLDFEKAS
jgi:type I restriction enzyme S subunit